MGNENQNGAQDNTNASGKEGQEQQTSGQQGQQTNGEQKNNPVQKTPEQLHDAVLAAVQAWEDNPTPENKEAVRKATLEAKEILIKEKKTAEEAAKALADKNKVPDNYDLKLPENSLLTKDRLDKIALIAKERGLSNEAAQQLVDDHDQLIAEHEEAKLKTVEDMQKSWLSTAQADKEIGGEKFKENAELAKRVLAKYGTPEFNAMLQNPKLGLFGNHPELVRVFVRIGREMSEDKFIHPSAQGGNKDKSIADSFYSKVDGGG